MSEQLWVLQCIYSSHPVQHQDPPVCNYPNLFSNHEEPRKGTAVSRHLAEKIPHSCVRNAAITSCRGSRGEHSLLQRDFGKCPFGCLFKMNLFGLLDETCSAYLICVVLEVERSNRCVHSVKKCSGPNPAFR